MFSFCSSSLLFIQKVPHIYSWELQLDSSVVGHCSSSGFQNSYLSHTWTSLWGQAEYLFTQSTHIFPACPEIICRGPPLPFFFLIYFVSFVPRHCLLLVGHESPTCMDIYPSDPWMLCYQSHGLIVFAILSSVALESHAVTCDRMLNVAKWDRTGHLDTLKK